MQEVQKIKGDQIMTMNVAANVIDWTDLQVDERVTLIKAIQGCHRRLENDSLVEITYSII